MPDKSPSTISAPTSIQLVDIGLIDSSPHNLPGRDKLNIDELADSIKARGLMNPISLAPKNGRFAVVAGHRRLAALKKLGMTQAPATIRASETDQDHVIDILVENLQREDVTVMQEARTYKQLESMGMKQREIGKQVGKSQPSVAKRLALADLPTEIQDAVDAGGIHVNDAYTLAVELKDDPEAQMRVFNNRTRGNINFLIAATKRGAEAKAAAANGTAAPAATDEDLTAQKDAAAKRRLVTKLVKLADEARFKALQAVVKARTAKTKLLDFTFQGLIEIIRSNDASVETFDATASLLAINRINAKEGFGQVWDVTEFINRNAEENWIRLAHLLVLMKGHLALVGAKEPLTGDDQKFAALTLNYLTTSVGYKTNQGEDYLLGLLDIGEIEPPVKEEKPKPEPKKKGKKAAAAEGTAVTTETLPITIPEGRVQCPECNGTGVNPSDSEAQCAVCEGSGTVEASA